MAPTNKNKILQTKQNKTDWQSQIKKLELQKFVLDPHYVTPICVFLLLVEAVLNVVIIEKVKYTEIDWIAYMQEVEGFLNGTLDYKELKG